MFEKLRNSLRQVLSPHGTTTTVTADADDSKLESQPPEVIYDIYKRIATDLVRELTFQIHDTKLIATGNLLHDASEAEIFKPSVIEKLGNIFRNEKTRPLITVSLPFYGKYMEYGTRPHFPPVAKIMRWLYDKQIFVEGVDSPQKVRRVAFAISRKISKEGLAPRHYVKNALTALEIKYSKNIIYNLIEVRFKDKPR